MSETANTGSAAGGVGATISDWKTYTKNTLRAFFTLTMPSGMVLHGCTYHQRNDSRWIGFPSQKFAKADGSVGYTAIIEFTTDDAHRRFQEQAIAAVDGHLGGQR